MANVYMEELTSGYYDYKFVIIGRESGTADITFTIYGKDSNGEYNVVYDTKTIAVMVEFEAVGPLVSYTILEHEWQYGDDIIVQVWSNGNRAAMYIAGTGEMWDSPTAKANIGVRRPWYEYDYCNYVNRIDEIVIGEGVTYIEGLAIISLKSLSLPATLKSVGDSCFSGCYQLTEIILPEGVEKVEDSAFSRCDGVTKIELPSTLRYIGMGAFCLKAHLKEENANKVTNVTIPAGVEYIDYGAFEYRWNIKINVPDSLDTTEFDPDWDAIY